MNLIDHYVVDVHGVEKCVFTSEEGNNIDFWVVYATVDCYGRVDEQEITVFSEKEAYSIKKGYHYLA